LTELTEVNTQLSEENREIETVLLLPHQTLDMSHNTSSDAEAIASTTFPEKTPQDAVITALPGRDIDSQDLPKGYYRSPLFIGTLIASGLSVMAVSSTETSIQRAQN
jgi:hypothetical protein